MIKEKHLNRYWIALNIALGLMAVVVHGIRLNMLEFSSHLGMQWSGIKYEPFRE